jgi:hypothetical protein
MAEPFLHLGDGRIVRNRVGRRPGPHGVQANTCRLAAMPIAFAFFMMML